MAGGLATRARVARHARRTDATPNRFVPGCTCQEETTERSLWHCEVREHPRGPSFKQLRARIPRVRLCDFVRQIVASPLPLPLRVLMSQRCRRSSSMPDACLMRLVVGVTAMTPQKSASSTRCLLAYQALMGMPSPLAPRPPRPSPL